MSGRASVMAVALTIPPLDSLPLSWWRQTAEAALLNVVDGAGRRPHGRVLTELHHANPARVTARVDTRPKPYQRLRG